MQRATSQNSPLFLSLNCKLSRPKLSSSSAQLTNALTTLCYTSYPTFLSIHATISTLTSSLSSLSSSLDALISSLPALENSARSFAEDTREIQKERRKAAFVLEHHDKLYDVLSLPLLLDSCVRNHSYTDVLLANHSNSLSQRFPSNPLVQSVKAECDARVQAMLGQLLRMLIEQAKLPGLFRAAGFLRKMDVLTEPELALAFLTGRGTYLESLFKTVEIEKKAI
ncbi:Dor1-domain-containing protein [Laetiporus sulphureus 93-53]|uniref:Conserved oligomeric Golgi complex subunit 8 n=1 Tax=Laetiporus sulphureus 93-53 TaxID=1314785 RepID=A0A165FCH9_9APHY|nr:Dor1-domain-containing protein [Laetiporus sulphureus 93-53]KZT08761.1 Dor1-domain-containing protein [Laetiporus sulphureus 93-53]